MRKAVSGLILALLVIGMLTLAFNIQPVKSEWTGTVYIRSDGSVEPTGAPVNTTDGITYYLWDNITVNDLFASGIVIERDNIVLDGNGLTIHGSASSMTMGVNVSQRSNATIKNLSIEGHAMGINIYQSFNIKIQANTIVNNSWGIDLSYSNSSIITENNLADNGYGVRLATSSNNIISGNNITGPGDGIIIQDDSESNVIVENYLSGSIETVCSGISIAASYNKILRNIIASFFADGISVSYASHNFIYGNNITVCGASGVNLYEYGDNNTVVGNTIAMNGYGIYIYMANYNRIYHNNFYENGMDIYVDDGVINYFDGGYPQGGNYWGFAGNDLYYGSNQNIEGSDGIIDSPYQPYPNVIDNYPLSAPFTPLPTIAIGNLAFNIEVVSNSTLSAFQFNVNQKSVSFNVTGVEGTTGFCRVTIPKDLLRADDGWIITVGGQQITNYTIIPDENYTYLYFTYNHSTKTITIKGTWAVPEFPSTIILLLLMLTTLITIILLKKKRKQLS